MHWLGYNDAVPSENSNISVYSQFLKNLSASLPAVRPGCARCRAPEIHMIKIVAMDLRKCCSKDDLPTVPWRFLLSFFLLSCSSLFL